jgi:hypothetical protein
MKFSAAICLECGTLLLSKHVHDYQSCSCDNEAFIDGGSCYQRAGGHDLSKIYVCAYDETTGTLTDDVSNLTGHGPKARWPY